MPELFDVNLTVTTEKSDKKTEKCTSNLFIHVPTVDPPNTAAIVPPAHGSHTQNTLRLVFCSALHGTLFVLSNLVSEVSLDT